MTLANLLNFFSTKRAGCPLPSETDTTPGLRKQKPMSIQKAQRLTAIAAAAVRSILTAVAR